MRVFRYFWLPRYRNLISEINLSDSHLVLNYMVETTDLKEFSTFTRIFRYDKNNLLLGVASV